MARFLAHASLMAILAGCTGSAPGGDSGRDVPHEVASVPCMSDRTCTPMRQLCDRQQGVCVDCLQASDCTGTNRACQTGRCVTVMPCTSSRQCPGRVCSTTLGYCVDCLMDVDCGEDQVCRRNSCVPAPPACMSTRECTAMGLVCDTRAGHCVECLADTDCAPEQYCSPQADCQARVCMPGTTGCLDAMRMRTCSGNGSAWAEMACATGAVCAADRCQMRICTPAAASCQDLETRRICNMDGLGYTPMPCGAMETCRMGTCTMRLCTPGEADCADVHTRRICNTDGLGYASTACGMRESCRTGACLPWLCTPGVAECTPSGLRQVCSPEGTSWLPMPCATMQTCRMGTCQPWVCTPDQAMCADTRTVRVCNEDGLGTTTTACTGMDTCTAGRCTTWLCTPGAGECTSGSERRVCNPDGVSYRTSPCMLGAGASAVRCEAGACVLTCVAGQADCNHASGDGCEVTLATSPTNCGTCGNACPMVANGTSTCVAGSCGFTCNMGYGNCDGMIGNGCEVNLAGDRSNCGACGAACPAGLSCTAGGCVSDPTFRVASLGRTGCRVAGHAMLSGDDRGGIALSTTTVFYSGDTATAALDAGDLGGGRAVMPIHDGMFSDLADGTVYVLLDSADREVRYMGSFPFLATQLGVLDPMTGALTTARVALSPPIMFPRPATAGLFSGYGRALLHNTMQWFHVRLPAGTVMALRPVPLPMSTGCESWAIWGVAEYFGGEHYAVFVDSPSQIVRCRVSDGMISRVAGFSNLGDMCSFTVSPGRGRWYFHHETPSEFSSTEQTLGYCEATFEMP